MYLPAWSAVPARSRLVINARVRIHPDHSAAIRRRRLSNSRSLGGCCGSRRSGLGGVAAGLAVAGVFFLAVAGESAVAAESLLRGVFLFRLGLGVFSTRLQRRR